MKRSEFLKFMGLGALSMTLPMSLIPEQKLYFDVDKLKQRQEELLNEFRKEKENAYLYGLYKRYDFTLDTYIKQMGGINNKIKHEWTDEDIL